MAGEGRSESSEVARHIARVAARLFAARGYDATSVREIVEAANVTKPTLYYHFGSKEGLAQALLTRPMSRLIEELRSIIGGSDDPVEALVGFVAAEFAFCREDPDRVRFLYALLFGPLGSSLSAELMRCGEAMDEVEAEAVRRAAEAGAVDPTRVDACVMALKGMIVISTMDYLYRGGDLGPDLPRRLVSDLLRGFGAPQGTPGRRAPVRAGERGG